MAQQPPMAATPGGAPQEGGGQTENQVADLVTNLGSGLTMFVEALQGSGAPPEVMEQAAMVLEGFKGLTDMLGGGGGGPQQQGGGQAMGSPEAAGAAASPANPAMRG
jgi:hypothetical protein